MQIYIFFVPFLQVAALDYRRRLRWLTEWGELFSVSTGTAVRQWASQRGADNHLPQSPVRIESPIRTDSSGNHSMSDGGDGAALANAVNVDAGVSKNVVIWYAGRELLLHVGNEFSRRCQLLLALSILLVSGIFATLLFELVTGRTVLGVEQLATVVALVLVSSIELVLVLRLGSAANTETAVQISMLRNILVFNSPSGDIGLQGVGGSESKQSWTSTVSAVISALEFRDVHHAISLLGVRISFTLVGRFIGVASSLLALLLRSFYSDVLV